MEKRALEFHRMFKHACAFADCASLCEEEPSKFEYRFQAHTVAGIVNSAFACEVFLKALLVFHEEKIEKEHELKKLWNKYREKDPQTAAAIKDMINRWFEADKEELFDEKLDVVSNNFMEWRYIYEWKDAKTNILFLKGMRLVLRGVCCEQFYGKSWDEFIGREDMDEILL